MTSLWGRYSSQLFASPDEESASIQCVQPLLCASAQSCRLAVLEAAKLALCLASSLWLSEVFFATASTRKSAKCSCTDRQSSIVAGRSLSELPLAEQAPRKFRVKILTISISDNFGCKGLNRGHQYLWDWRVVMKLPVFDSVKWLCICSPLTI